MNLTNHFWYFKKALSDKICDDIIKLANLKKDESKLAVIGETRADINKKPLNQKEKKDLLKQRNSNIIWLNEKWLYKNIHPFIHFANEAAGWNFQWDFTEEIQFTKYKLNQHYSWHCDSWEKPYNTPKNQNYQGKIRKLSVIVSLSDPKDYTGGKLEFQFRNQNDPTKTVECKEVRERGTIIVFPSFVWHRVTPVRKGTRYSLVMWNLGYPFK